MALKPYDNSARLSACRVLCSVAFEHAESAKMLIVAGNFTSAAGLLRLQYEALARAIWLLYAASDVAVEKISAELTQEPARKAEKMPMTRHNEGESQSCNESSRIVFRLIESKAHNKMVKSFVALLLTRTPGFVGRRLP